MDVGCGSGVLLVLYKQAIGEGAQNYYAIDKNYQAVKNTVLNCQMNGIKVEATLNDIVDDS